MWLTFRHIHGAVTVKTGTVAQPYRDATPGTEWPITGSGVELTLPYTDWPREAIMGSDTQRFEYERATVGGVLGWRLRKLSSP